MPLKSKESETFHEAMDSTACKHNNDGYQVTEIWCDNAFSKLMDVARDDMNVEMECVAPEEHEAAAEGNN